MMDKPRRFTDTARRVVMSDHDHNGTVELMELVDYVREVVDREGKDGKYEQTPWLSRRELFGDFALVQVP